MQHDSTLLTKFQQSGIKMDDWVSTIQHIISEPDGLTAMDLVANIPRYKDPPFICDYTSHLAAANKPHSSLSLTLCSGFFLLIQLINDRWSPAYKYCTHAFNICQVYGLKPTDCPAVHYGSLLLHNLHSNAHLDEGSKSLLRTLSYKRTPWDESYNIIFTHHDRCTATIISC